MHVNWYLLYSLLFQYKVIRTAGRIRPTNYELVVSENSIYSALSSTLSSTKTGMAGHRNRARAFALASEDESGRLQADNPRSANDRRL